MQVFRTFLRPGDGLWFCGRGFASRAIALWTCSIPQLLAGQWISHCGTIVRMNGEIKHVESTTMNDMACDIQQRQVRGVQVNDPWERIGAYQGRVYMTRLRVPLTKQQSEALTASAEAFLGTPYDTRQALLAGTRWIKRYFAADRSAVFCDELRSMLLMDAGKIPEGLYAPHDETPASLLRRALRTGIETSLLRLK